MPKAKKVAQTQHLRKRLTNSNFANFAAVVNETKLKH